jgi:hypothetical protein
VLAPGCWVTILAGGFVSRSTTAAGVPLPKLLGGASVSVDRQPAPLQYVSDKQINALIPIEVSEGDNRKASVIVTTAQGASSPALTRSTLIAAPRHCSLETPVERVSCTLRREFPAGRRGFPRRRDHPYMRRGLARRTRPLQPTTVARDRSCSSESPMRSRCSSANRKLRFCLLV